MASDYISREVTIQHIKDNQCKGCSEIGLCGDCAVLIALKLLKNVPAADIRPVRSGTWIESRKHIWRKDENGETDTFAFEWDYHNGPVCEKCGIAPCIHCDPDFDKEDCKLTHYVCSVCGRTEMKKEPFCHCGADMREVQDGK